MNGLRNSFILINSYVFISTWNVFIPWFNQRNGIRSYSIQLTHESTLKQSERSVTSPYYAVFHKHVGNCGTVAVCCANRICYNLFSIYHLIFTHVVCWAGRSHTRGARDWYETMSDAKRWKQKKKRNVLPSARIHLILRGSQSQVDLKASPQFIIAKWALILLIKLHAHHHPPYAYV